jgi:hypothetical protein
MDTKTLALSLGLIRSRHCSRQREPSVHQRSTRLDDPQHTDNFPVQLSASANCVASNGSISTSKSASSMSVTTLQTQSQATASKQIRKQLWGQCENCMRLIC